MKRKNSLQRTILLVATLALAVVAIFLYVSRPSQIDQLGQPYIDTIEDKQVIKKAVKTKYKETYSVNDYTYYGESLKLYHETLSARTDDLQGKNIILHNIENGKEFSYTLSSGAEDGIQTGLLDPGLYEVYTYDHFIKKRLYYKDEIHVNDFTTIRRDKNVNTVSIDASKDFLSRFGIEMDKNYLFISVTENIPMVKNIDVMIDPCGDMFSNSTNQVILGTQNDKISEQKSSYEMAVQLKEELESKGLRVELTRDKDGNPSYYGKNGRVGQAYRKNAKVFISLGIADDEYISRPLIVVSPYTSGILANNIASVSEEQGLDLSNSYVMDNPLEVGVLFDPYIVKEEKETKYEQYVQLRESGGRLTYTGKEEHSKDNSRYSKSYGMYGILYMYANIQSDESVEYYKKNQDKMVQGIAQGIYQYFSL